MPRRRQTVPSRREEVLGQKDIGVQEHEREKRQQRLTEAHGDADAHRQIECVRQHVRQPQGELTRAEERGGAPHQQRVEHVVVRSADESVRRDDGETDALVVPEREGGGPVDRTCQEQQTASGERVEDDPLRRCPGACLRPPHRFFTPARGSVLAARGFAFALPETPFTI